MKLELTGPEIEKIQQAADLLKRNLKNAFTIHRLAKEVGINEKRLKTGFKKVFGKGVHTFLLHARMERAKELLLEDRPIRYIAAVVGYNGNVANSNFIKAFRKLHGETPLSWKKRQMNGSDKFGLVANDNSDAHRVSAESSIRVTSEKESTKQM